MKRILVADLLCGAGGSSTGCARALASLGLHMELVCVNHWGIAIETHKLNHPEARHYCQDIATVRPHLIVPEGYLDLLLASPTCFPAGTLVLTENGFEAIETIPIGRRVLTHRGRWRRVTGTMQALRDTLVVRGHGHPGIETTAEHPFLACERRARHRPKSGEGRHRYCEPDWIAAADLDPDAHFWATPTSFESLHIPPVPGRGFEFTYAFWWVVGRWLGDGYFGERHGRRSASIIICCGRDEADALQSQLNFAAPKGRRAARSQLRWLRRDQPTGVRFETEHKGLAAWLREQFGKLAHGKKLPAWALGMPHASRQALLEGYLSADGWRDHRKCEVYTVSKQLALGMRLLAESLGYRVALRLTKARQNSIEGRTVRQRDQYHLVWVDSREHEYAGVSDGHSWLRLRSISHARKAAPVFNLSVEEDESYIAEGIVVHNCTHHSAARGGKPTSDQQRSDPWHIVTWLTELRVKRVIIENVPEFVSWGPVDARTGRPVKARKGEYFKAWTDTIRRLGFELEWRILSAADYGDATTRRRFFLQARSDGRPIAWPAPTHMKREEGKLALFPGVKPWRAAREIIDWSIKGRSIFGRKKPLSAKTLARIHAGAVKFGWPGPFLVILRNHMAAQSVDGPVPTVAARGNHIGLAQPMLMANRKNATAKSTASEPIPSLDTKGGVWLAEPFVLSNATSGAPRAINDPVPTITTGGAAAEKRQGCARHALVEPFILSRQGGGAPRSVDEPTPTQCAKHSHALIAPYYGSGSGETCSSAAAPLPTVTAKARHAMVIPVTHHDGSDRARDVAAPLPTITTAKRGEFAFIAAAFGEREGQAPRVHDVAQPAPTIPAQGRINLVEPGEHYDILFRMLEPHELAAAMGFDSDDAAYEFVGTKTEKIKQIGNAVPVNTACALVKAVMADAAAAAPHPAAKRRAAA